VPGTRPLAFWQLNHPDAPPAEDEEGRLRYLASIGDLDDWEIEDLAAAAARDSGWVPEALERFRRRYAAVLEGLAARDDDHSEGDS